MPFLTQGKTNWKYILIVVILAFIVGGGILGWKYLRLPKEEKIVPQEKAAVPVGTSMKLATIGEGFEVDISLDIKFSPDKNRVAYKAKKDGKWFMIVNDRISEAYDYVGSFDFSPDSKQLAYAAKKDGKWFLVVNGQKDKNYYDGVSLITFSPDSKKLVYVAKKGTKEFVVINGKEGKEYDDIFWDPTFSLDSKQLAYGARKGKKMFIVVNNQEGKPYDRVRYIIFGPDSKKLAYIADKEGKELVVTNGKESKAYESVENLTFSPDSKRLAYVTRKEEKEGMNPWLREYVVVVNDQEGKVYNAIENLVFSPDSEKLAYVAGYLEENEILVKKFFVVVDGREGKIYSKIVLFGPTVEKPLFSPDSKQLVFVAWDEYETPDGFHETRRFIVIDGKEEEVSYTIDSSTLTFSPDSKKLAYVASQREKSFVVVTGQKGKEYDKIWGISFSSDGKYIIYGAKIGNELWRIVDKIE